MSVCLEQLAQILAKVGISSSQEEEILTVIKALNAPPEAKEELIVEESCVSDDEKLFEQKIEEDEEGVSGELNPKEHHVYESCIEQWFQVGIHLDKFRFYFYVVSFPLRQLDSFIFVNFYFSFEKLIMNIFILLLRAWLHWLFDYT